MLAQSEGHLATSRRDEDVVHRVCQTHHWVMPFQGYGHVIDVPIISHGWQIEPVLMMDPRIPLQAKENIVDLKHAGLAIAQIWYGHPDVPPAPKYQPPQIQPTQIQVPWQEVKPVMEGSLQLALLAAGLVITGIAFVVQAIANDPAVFAITESGSIFLVYSWEE
jgi:hypothetical protein